MGLSRKSKKLLRIIAPAAFFVFLILLQFHLSRRDPRRVCVDAISPFHNFSRVRVEGVLESGARRLRGGSVLYMVNDGSGTIAVFDEQAVGVEAVKGTRISAEGYLNVGANNDVRLRAKSVELHEWNLPPAPAGCELVNITANQKGEQVTVYGRIYSIWHPPAGSRAPHKVLLSDESGSIEIVHWLSDFPEVAVGENAKVSGVVETYRGKIQLRVSNALDFRVRENLDNSGS